MFSKSFAEKLVVFSLIIATVFFIQLQYIFGLVHKPQNTLYLGTVHWPSDYFYYLSQMVQGKEHILSSRMLYTNEKMPYVYIGWQHVLIGRIGSLLHLRVIESYQLGVILSLTLFLSFTYLLIRKIFPESAFRRILAFFFFISSTSLPLINFGKNGIGWGYYTFWYNTGNIFGRLGPTPHHLLAGTFFVVVLLLAIKWWERKDKKIHFGYLIGIAVFSFLLASINPVQWGLLMGAVSITVFVINFPIFAGPVIRVSRLSLQGYFLLLHKPSPIKPSEASVGNPRSRHPLNLVYLFPSLFIFLAGLPAALYAKYVFSIPPYSYSSVWEVTQQLGITPKVLLLGSGIVVVYALFGIIPFIKKRKAEHIFAVAFVAFAALFYFTSIPYRLHLTNARFWPPVTYIFISCLVVEGIYILATYMFRFGMRFFGLFSSLRHFVPQGKRVYPDLDKIGRRAQVKRSSKFIPRLPISFFLVFLILLYLITIIPSHYAQQREILAAKAGNAFIYLPKDAYDAFLIASDLSKKDTIFLIQWPFNESFSALTGRISFIGFSLLTIDADKKGDLIYRFFDGKMTDKEMIEFLHQYKINYIVGYWWNPKLNTLQGVTRVYTNGTMAIDRVE